MLHLNRDLITLFLSCTSAAILPADEPKEVLADEVTEVSWTMQTSLPPNLFVKAYGKHDTNGVVVGRLVRTIYTTPPHDGIQEYTLMLLAGAGATVQPSGFVVATETWDHFTTFAPWIKGIRVRGAKGSIVKRFSDR
jgi:hypothetical protein